MVDVLPERGAGAAELHGNANVVQPAGEHVPVEERHCSRPLGGQGSGSRPHGHIDREEQLRGFAALDARDDATAPRKPGGA